MSIETIQFLNEWDMENQYWEDLCAQYDIDQAHLEAYL